jgi:hypothetical protein
MTDLQKLNNLVSPFLKEIEKDLNKWSCVRKEETEDTVKYPELSRQNIASISKLSSGVHPLNEFIAGLVIDKDKNKEDVNVITVRCLFGYALASDIINGKTPPEYLKAIVKKLINDLVYARGFGPDKLNSGVYGTFEIQGSPGMYVLELENYAAYELRLYSNTVLCE